MFGKKFTTVFWPLLLIIVGVLWLLANMDLLDTTILRVFVNLWPLLLIAIGLNILVKPRFPEAGIWIALGTLVLALAISVAAPSMGWFALPELQQAHFEEPLGSTESAQVTLDLSIGSSTVAAGRSEIALIEADVSYYNDASLNVEGQEQKTARLRIDNQGVNTSPFNIFSDFIGDEPRADVLLSPDVPLDLVVNVSVGQVDLDLSGLTLESLEVNGGVGEIYLVLPAQSERYSVRIDGGVGRVRLEVPEGANVSLDISGGVGDFSIYLPDNAPVRLDGEADVGNIRVPSFMKRVTERASTVGRSGIWESAAYPGAEVRIDIEFRGGVGSLTVR